MKKRMFGKMFFVGLVGISVGFNALGYAAVSSDGEINLVENKSPTAPKDPLDPSKPQEPADPNNPPTNEKGPLSIDAAPKGFYFGTQKMYHAAHEYKAEGLADHRQCLQVTDNREAETYGWTLKVRQDGYLRDEKTNYELKGATLTLPAGEARNRNNGAGSTELAFDLVTYGVEVGSEEKVVFSAPSDSAKKAGKSTSTNSWQSQSVSLNIPKDTARAGNYSNKIYWILTDGGPTN
ncbi:WxL domain-containing protein [Enterococcus sp. AZ196]|uniref:WxL domain-containing protein n=1 Tax=Enterococcus sp. AZ196 TaxID=2774659 RepID=UPI003D28F9C8